MNQGLPSLKAKEVIRALQRVGFVASRTSSSHCRLNPFEQSRPQGHRCKAVLTSIRGTLRGIISQAGLTVTEFIALL